MFSHLRPLPLSPPVHHAEHPQNAYDGFQDKPFDCPGQEAATLNSRILLSYSDGFWFSSIAKRVPVPVGVLLAYAVLGLGDPVFPNVFPVASPAICILMDEIVRVDQVHCHPSASYSVALVSCPTCAPLPTAVISDFACCGWSFNGHAGATSIDVYSPIPNAAVFVFYKTVLVCVGGDVQGVRY
jgi:hypothetical protein